VYSLARSLARWFVRSCSEYLVKELEQVDVVALGAKVVLQQPEQAREDDERVVDGDRADLVLLRRSLDRLHRAMSIRMREREANERAREHTTYARHAIPARRTTARDALVHEVVGDQKVRLQQLDAPAEHHGLLLELGRQRAHQLLKRRHDRQSSSHLASDCRVVEKLSRIEPNRSKENTRTTVRIDAV